MKFGFTYKSAVNGSVRMHFECYADFGSILMYCPDHCFGKMDKTVIYTPLGFHTGKDAPCYNFKTNKEYECFPVEALPENLQCDYELIKAEFIKYLPVLRFEARLSQLQMTQVQFSKVASVSQQAITKWKKNLLVPKWACLLLDLLMTKDEIGLKFKRLCDSNSVDLKQFCIETVKNYSFDSQTDSFSSCMSNIPCSEKIDDKLAAYDINLYSNNAEFCKLTYAYHIDELDEDIDYLFNELIGDYVYAYSRNDIKEAIIKSLESRGQSLKDPCFIGYLNMDELYKELTQNLDLESPYFMDCNAVVKQEFEWDSVEDKEEVVRDYDSQWCKVSEL